MEKQEYGLSDGRKVLAPPAISLTEHTPALDELEYRLWGIAKEYFDAFGIVLLSEDTGTPDFDMVKGMADACFAALEKAGIRITADGECGQLHVGGMSCEACRKQHAMPNDSCCLFECGESPSCKGCSHGIYEGG